jgi:squalene-associated FAD-dependent desaturase
MPHVNVAIIGGGYAGMAAAVELCIRNIPVTVFEAGLVPGGRARRVEHEGVALDNGLHILIGAYRETLRLIRQVNPQHAHALQRWPLDWHIHHEFRLTAPRLPAPLHMLAALLSAHGIGWQEKTGAIRFMQAMRHNSFALVRDISVTQLLAQHGQSEKLRRVLWHPLCIAALNTPPEIASAQIFLNILRDTLNAARADSDLLLARVDLSALFPEPAAVWVADHGGTVHTATRVTAIEPLEQGFAVTAASNRIVERITFSHVICALPPHQVNAFLIGITALSEIAETLEQFQYQPIHSVWLQYPSTVTLPSPMLGFSQGIVHWLFDRAALCGQPGLLGAVISASGAHLQLPQDALAQAVHQTLKEALGDLPEPTWARVIAEKRATFSCVPGLKRPPSITPLRNFYLAGDYTDSDYPATLEAAVLSGITCAQHIQATA